MTSLHYQPGTGSEWLAAVTEGRMLLIRAAKTSETDALWSAIASTQGVQAALDELTRGGLSTTPPFALVEWEKTLGSTPSIVHAIIRGDVAITVHSAENTLAVDASGVSTWLEREFDAVTGIEVRAGAARSAGDGEHGLPLVSGVVVTDRVAIGTIGAGTSTSSAVARPELARTTTTAHDPETTVAGLTMAGLTMAGVTMAGVTMAGLEEQHLAARAGVSVEAESAHEQSFGETVVRKAADATVQTDAAPASAGSDATATDGGDHDGHTIASGDIAKLRAARRERAAQPAAPTPPTAPALHLELADGSRESLAAPILVGRAPSADKVSGTQIPRLLTVAGTDQDISRNHVRFAVEGGTVVVTDLHSRNGTLAILPGRDPQQLRPGEPTSVIVGTVIDLGGGVTFTVREG
jgi:hypothetical protein